MSDDQTRKPRAHHLRRVKPSSRHELQGELDAMSDAWHIQQATKMRRGFAETNIQQEMRLIHEHEQVIARLERLLAAERRDPDGMPASVEADIEQVRQEISQARERIAHQKELLADQHYLLTGEEPA